MAGLSMTRLSMFPTTTGGLTNPASGAVGIDKLLVITDFTAQALAQHNVDGDRRQILDGVEDAVHRCL